MKKTFKIVSTIVNIVAFIIVIAVLVLFIKGYRPVNVNDTLVD